MKRNSPRKVIEVLVHQKTEFQKNKSKGNMGHKQSPFQCAPPPFLNFFVTLRQREGDTDEYINEVNQIKSEILKSLQITLIDRSVFKWSLLVLHHISRLFS